MNLYTAYLAEKVTSAETVALYRIFSTMQFSTLNASLSSRQTAYPLTKSRSQSTRQRASSLVVRADDGFCRDKINEPKARVGVIEGTSTVVFVGAGGEQIEVQAAKVSQ